MQCEHVLHSTTVAIGFGIRIRVRLRQCKCAIILSHNNERRKARRLAHADGKCSDLSQHGGEAIPARTCGLFGNIVDLNVVNLSVYL